MPHVAARPLDAAEIPLLHAANPDPRTRALLWIGLCTGLRVGEIVRLNIQHVLGPTGAILDELVLDKAVILKHGKPRSVPMNPLLRTALNPYLLTLSSLQPCWPLFQSRIGFHKRLGRRQAMRIVVAAFERAGLDGALSSHSLRKTFASAIHRRLGQDLAKTQQALAHASPASTVLYLESCDAQIRDAIRTLYLPEFAPDLPNIAN